MATQTLRPRVAIMKQTVNCSLDCIKQLLPNIAASGLWVAGAAAITLPSTAVAVPLVVGLGCVAAYIGLKRACAAKSEEDERHDLSAALSIIRKRTTNTEKELAGLGYQVQFSVEDVHRRLTTLDTSIAGLSGKLDDLDSHFRDHRDDFDRLCLFLQVNFNELKPYIEALPATLVRLKHDNKAFRDQMDRVEAKIDTTLVKADQVVAQLVNPKP
jgi:hypothetical protein